MGEWRGKVMPWSAINTALKLFATSRWENISRASSGSSAFKILPDSAGKACKRFSYSVSNQEGDCRERRRTCLGIRKGLRTVLSPWTMVVELPLTVVRSHVCDWWSLWWFVVAILDDKGVGKQIYRLCKVE